MTLCYMTILTWACEKVASDLLLGFGFCCILHLLLLGFLHHFAGRNSVNSVIVTVTI